jgi:hypothetical protein
MSQAPAPPGFVRFEPGEHVALLGAEQLVLLGVGVHDAFVARLWPLVRAGAGVAELLEELSAHGIRALPSFVIVDRRHRGCHVVVRGAGVVQATTAGVERRITGAGLAAWFETVVDGFDELACALEEAPTGVPDAPPFFAERGIVPARWLRLGPPGERPPGAPPTAADAPAPTIVAVEAAPASAAPEGSATVDEPVVEGVVEVQVEAQVEPVAELVVPDAAVAASAAAPAAPPAELEPPSAPTLVASATILERPGPVVEPPVEPEPDDYSHLFGATIFRSVADAVRGAPVDEPEEATVRLRPAIARPGSLIDGTPPSPAFPPGSGRLGGPAEADDLLGDHDGRTMKIDRALLARARAATAPPAAAGPTVLALHCAAGHPNPPQAMRCSRCNALVPPGEPVPVPRPSLGRLRFSDGTVVELDGPRVIGRSPFLQGTYGSELPELVVLQSPEQNLSKNHLEIRLQDWRVYAVDLGSSNGTELTLPGRDPQRLFPNQPALLEPGCRLVLGSEVTAEFEGGR